MTNEQTKLLLNMIADQIDELVNDVKLAIREGEREKEYVWIGEGKKPEMSLFYHPALWQLQEKPNGEFVAVVTIRDFAEKIRDYAEEL